MDIKSTLQNALTGGIQYALLQDSGFWPTKSTARSIFLKGDLTEWITFYPRTQFNSEHVHIKALGKIWLCALADQGTKIKWSESIS